MYRLTHGETVRVVTVGRWAVALTSVTSTLALTGSAAAETNLQETMPLVWVLLAMSIAGGAITFAILAYAIWKFRDPATKRRRYG
jgi:hypothetical protein